MEVEIGTQTTLLATTRIEKMFCHKEIGKQKISLI